MHVTHAMNKQMQQSNKSYVKVARKCDTVFRLKSLLQMYRGFRPSTQPYMQSLPLSTGCYLFIASPSYF